jgi:prepilin-type N-terminal cleavage/methylation domain-containing protein
MKYSQESGFTLVEIISVLVIVGILSAVALPDFFNLQDRIRRKMVDNVISDLNHREYLVWATHFESKQNHDDGIVFNLVNPGNIGAKFTWSTGPSESEPSTITFGSINVNVKRSPSTAENTGFWEKTGDDAPNSGKSSQDGGQDVGNPGGGGGGSPGQSGNAPGQGGSSPGQSGNAPGKN